MKNKPLPDENDRKNLDRLQSLFDEKKFDEGLALLETLEATPLGESQAQAFRSMKKSAALAIVLKKHEEAADYATVENYELAQKLFGEAYDTAMKHIGIFDIDQDKLVVYFQQLFKDCPDTIELPKLEGFIEQYSAVIRRNFGESPEGIFIRVLFQSYLRSVLLKTARR